jgi:hypothetical protein
VENEDDDEGVDHTEEYDEEEEEDEDENMSISDFSNDDEFLDFHLIMEQPL